jgi:hypothetical protein
MTDSATARSDPARWVSYRVARAVHYTAGAAPGSERLGRLEVGEVLQSYDRRAVEAAAAEPAGATVEAGLAAAAGLEGLQADAEVAEAEAVGLYPIDALQYSLTTSNQVSYHIQ